MFEAVGLMVSRLMRVRYGPVHLSPRLKRGQCRDLEPAEVQELLKLLPPLQKSGSPVETGFPADDYDENEFDLDAGGDRIDSAEE